MDNTTRNTDNSKVEFDYLYLLLKSWKTILIFGLVFFVIGVLIVSFSSKIHTATSSFSITLKPNIATAYGSYDLKTKNPLHYLEKIEKNDFKEKVLIESGYESLKDIKFEIEEEEIKVDPKSSLPIPPEKFDFLVSGFEEKALPKINETAITLFLESMDRNIQNEMYNQFIAEKRITIDNLQFAIDIKQKLIDELKEGLKSGVKVKTDKTNFKELIDDRLINSLEGSERGLIISMMLSGDKGNQYYQETILTVEEVQLKTMLNSLERQELLLAKLIENKENGTLSSIFNLPFSTDYYMLTSPEVENVSALAGNLKKIIIFTFLGLFFSTSYVLAKGYYNMFYKDK